MKKAVALLLIVGLALAVVGCSSAAPNKIVGKWTLMQNDAPQTLDFRADGSLSVRVAAGAPEKVGRYVLEGDQVTITLDGITQGNQVKWDTNDKFTMINSAGYEFEVTRQK